MEFLTPLEVPDDLKERINEQKILNVKRNLANGASSQSNYVEVLIVRQNELDDDDYQFGKPLLRDWSIAQFYKDGIVIDLDIESPLLISQEDEPDLLFVQLELSVFKDENGNSLPQSLVK